MRGVQIDIEPDMLSLRYPMEVNLVGDAAETLRLLLPLLDRKEDRKWRGEIEKQVADWWKLLGERAMQPAKPVNPQRVVWELSSRLTRRGGPYAIAAKFAHPDRSLSTLGGHRPIQGPR